MDNKKELISYINNILLLVVGVVFLLFPLVFTSQVGDIITGDIFTLPKQIILGGSVILLLVLFAVKTVLEGKISFRSTPFDIPVLLFMVAAFVSSILSMNKYDSLISFVPLLFATLFFFLTVNIVKDKSSILFIVASILTGSILLGIFSILAYLKIFILPVQYAQSQLFSPIGGLFDQALYLAFTLPIAGYLAYPLFAKKASAQKDSLASFAVAEGTKVNPKLIAFAASFVIIAASLLVTIYMLLTIQKPAILPLETGFTTAFSSISRDDGRVVRSFLLGSGYGTFNTVFSRFKDVAYNANDTLWSLTFFRSSTYLLELLATTGVLGFFSFIFIFYRIIKERMFFIPILLAMLAAAVLPFSFVLQGFFFMLLALFAVIAGTFKPRRYPTLELYLVALRQGLFLAKESDGSNKKGRSTHILPLIFSLIILLLAGILGFLSVNYVRANYTFRKSYSYIQQNNARDALLSQFNALQIFPFEDSYYTEFSQLNLRVANALAASSPQSTSPSAQLQQDILNAIQRSINAGRSAVTISPYTSLNWNNLSAIYRSLINFGQNADQFAIVTNQRAIELDGANPQQYINLGGIYYQLGQYDNAREQFQLAISAKRNYANAYYNLGHALEAKGDLTTALQYYQVVKELVAQDKPNTEKITAEIDTLQKKIGEQAVAGAKAPEAPSGAAADQSPLDVNKPSTQLPERDPKIKIPGPSSSPTPGKKTPTPSPTSEGPTPTGSEGTSAEPTPTPTGQ